MVEKPAFAFDAATVAGEGTVGADDAVAGQDDGDGIGSVGGADGANRGGMADLLGEFAIGDGGTAGDGAERTPNLTLKHGADGFDGEIVNGVEFSGEVAGQGGGEAVGIAGGLEVEFAGSILIGEMAMDRVFAFGEEGEAEMAGCVGDQHHLADGGGEPIEKQVKHGDSRN